jgi:lipopolysaccharide heptosyltransferase I
MAKAAAQRILLVRPSALGDVSRTVPVLVSLRQAHPEAQLDWLVAESFADAVRHHPMLDGVVTFARDRLARFGRSWSATREAMALFRRLRRRRYDTVYDCQGLLRSGLLTRVTGAPRRVGFADAREGATLGYTVRHSVTADHTVDRMLQLLETDGLPTTRDLRLYLGPADRAWIASLLERKGLHRFVCVAPTARWRCKCWPADRYTALIRRLLRQDLAEHVFILASPGEQAAVDPMLTALRNAGLGSRVSFPRTTVGQMMALIARCRLLVCNDSAPLHMAVGFDRPTVAIFGPTDPAKVGPYRRDDEVLQPAAARVPGFSFDYRKARNDQTLIAQVPEDAVWARVHAALV